MAGYTGGSSACYQPISDLENRRKAAFNAVKVELSEQIEVEEILLYFRAKNILTKDDTEQIRAQSGQKLRFEVFSDKVVRHPGWWNVLLEALEENNQQHVIHLLEKTLNERSTSGSNHISNDTSFSEAVQYLKDVYINDCEIMKNHWSKLMTGQDDYSEEYEIDRMYIDLEIIKEGMRSKEKITSYQELFGVKQGRRTYRKIVLEGDPGMGKSTYVHRLVQQWVVDKEENKEWSEGHAFLNKEFDLVILIRLGEVTPEQTLNTILAQTLPRPEFSNSLLNFVAEGTTHKKILVVLDAFDEMGQNRYFERLIGEQCIGTAAAKNLTLLISTRISHSGSRILKEKRDFLLRTFGFHPDTVKQNFSHKISNLEALSDQHGQVLLYRNPLFVGMAAFLGEIPQELFDLMEQFCLKVIERYLIIRAETKQDSSGAGSTLLQHWNLIKNCLGKIALTNLRPKIQVESTSNRAYVNSLIERIQAECNKCIENIGADIVNLCCETGLLWPKKKASQPDVEPGSILAKEASFPHQLFVEFFAAAYLTEMRIAESLCERAIQLKPLLYPSPFLYFFTGFSENWKKLTVDSCLKAAELKKTLHVYCPWICHTEDLPELHGLSNGVSIREINGCWIQNPGNFLQSAIKKYNLTIDPSIQIEKTVLDGPTFQLLSQDPNLESLHIKNSRLHENLNTNTMLPLVITDHQLFQKLQKLKISDIKDDSFLKFIGAILKSYFRHSNNNNLLQFELAGCTVKNPDPMFSELPESLEVLSIEDHCKLYESALNGLCDFLGRSTLTNLKLSQNADIGNHPQVFTAMPKTVTSLDISNCNLIEESAHTFAQYLEASQLLTQGHFSNSIGQYPEIFHALPLTLETLHLHDKLTDEAGDALSKHLKKASSLKTIISLFGDIWNVQMFSSMPLTLTHMAAGSTNLTQESVVAFSRYIKSSMLEHLNICAASNIGKNPQFFFALPRTLTNLIIQHVTLTEDSVNALSNYLNTTPMLQKLLLYYINSIGNYPNLFTALPKTLTELTIYKCNLTEQSVIALSHNLKEDALLQELRLEECDDIGKYPLFFSTLPKTLTTLVVDRCDITKESTYAFVQYLKESTILETLRVQSIGMGKHAQFFTALPKTLTSLDIEGCNLTLESVYSLSKYLKDAAMLQTLKACEQNNIIANPLLLNVLPKTLTVLELDNYNLEEDSIGALSEFLLKAKVFETLEIRQCDSTGNQTHFFAALPKTLKRLCIYKCRFTHDSAEVFSIHLEEHLLLETLRLWDCEDIVNHAEFFPSLPMMLKTLDIQMCNLTEQTIYSFSEYLKKSLALEQLTVCSDNIGQYPPFFTALPRTLESLDIRKCNLTKDSIHAFSKHLKESLNLKHLHLTESDDIVQNPHFFTDLPRMLTTLRISRSNLVGDNLPHHLKSYSMLQSLSICDGDIIGDQTQLFTFLPNTLTSLQIRRCKLADESVYALSSFLKESLVLKILCVEDIPKIGQHQEFFAFLPTTLAHIEIEKCNLTEKSVDALSSFLLETAVMLQTLRIGDDNVGKHQHFFAVLPKTLKTLKLCSCSLTEKSIIALSNYLLEAPVLKELELWNMGNITTYPSFFIALPKTLQRLFICDCRLTEESANAFTNYLQNSPVLESLNLWQSVEIANHPQLLAALPKTLKTLEIMQCNLTEESVVPLSQCLKEAESLQKLELRDEGDDIGKLFTSLPRTLCTLHVDGCELSEESVYSLAQYLKEAPALQRLHLSGPIPGTKLHSKLFSQRMSRWWDD